MAPEYISLFVDEQLRKGMKGTSEEEVDSILDKVVMLFRYLQDKDVRCSLPTIRFLGAALAATCANSQRQKRGGARAWRLDEVWLTIFG